MARVAAVAAVLLTLLVAVSPAFAQDEKTHVKIVYINEDQVQRESSFDNPEDAWDYAVREAAREMCAFIYLGKDWTISEQHELEEDNEQTIVLDLNGHAVIRDGGGKQRRNGGLFKVVTGTMLRIRDSNPRSSGYQGVRGGVITGGANTNGGGAITVQKSARLEIQGGTIYKCTSNEHGGAVLLEGKDSQLGVTGGRIYACQTTGAWSSCHGGAIYNNGGKIWLDDFAIDSCYSEDSGGALYMNGGEVRIKRARMTGNHCQDDGGAVCVNEGCLYMDDCRVSGCEAQKNGGAIYYNTSQGMKINGCIFMKNKARGDGGALYINDHNSAIINSDVIANSAAGFGGGIYVDSMRTLAIKGLIRVYNNSGKNGCNNVTLQDGTMSRATVSSGGLYEGSKVGLSSTSKNVPYALSISETQAAYFFSDRGSLEFRKTTEREAPFISTAFAEGGGSGIVLGTFMAVLAGTVVYLILSRRDKRNLQEASKQ